MSEKLRGHLLALFTSCVWGGTFICTKVLLTGLEPTAILLIRFVIGTLVLYPLCPRLMPFLGWKRELMLAGAGLCGLTVYYQLENLSLMYAPASLVSVIISTAPFFVALCTWLFLKGPRPKGIFYLGFAVSIGGISLLSFTGSAETGVSLRGVLMALGAAVAWGPYSVLTKKAEAFGYNTVQISRRIFLYGLLFMLPGVMLGGTAFPTETILRPAFGLNLLFLGVVASALCFVTWNEAIRHIGTVASSVYIYLSPVITVLLSVPVLGEPLTPRGVLGILLTLTGLVLSQL